MWPISCTAVAFLTAAESDSMLAPGQAAAPAKSLLRVMRRLGGKGENAVELLKMRGSPLFTVMVAGLPGPPTNLNLGTFEFHSAAAAMKASFQAWLTVAV